MVSSQADVSSRLELLTRASLSQVEDLDYAEAISSLTQLTFSLEAAQQSFVRIQGLSIFRYL